MIKIELLKTTVFAFFTNKTQLDYFKGRNFCNFREFLTSSRKFITWDTLICKLANIYSKFSALFFKARRYFIYQNLGLICRAFPVDTGRKLNVLCTFNLRPVSTGLSVLLLFKNSVTYFFLFFLLER